MAQRIAKFARFFFGALADCAVEEWGLIPLVLLVFCVVAVLLALGVAARVTWETIADPNSVDVSARLAQLSISPAKWS